MNSGPDNRRPIASRQLSVMRRLAAGLTRSGITPNAISLCSILFALLAALSFYLTSRSLSTPPPMLLWLGAALMIQARLLANLMDGLVAVEGGKGSYNGELYNEVPDRFSDVLILVGAGYAAAATPEYGLWAALAALLTAYIRAVGAAVGVGQVFHGVMGKSQRMFFLTLAALWMAFAPASLRELTLGEHSFSVLDLTLLLIAGLAGDHGFAPTRYCLCAPEIQSGQQTARRIGRLVCWIRSSSLFNPVGLPRRPGNS